MMDWSKVGELVADAAPILGAVLPIPGGAAIGAAIASKFGTAANPDAVAAAIKADPDAAVKLKQIEVEHETDMTRLLLAHEAAQITETQTTMRAEIQSDDSYVRRARPTFLYVAAFSVIVEVIIALVVVLWRPDQLSALQSLFSALATPQSIALAACGIYLKKRSDDKAVATGVPQGPGLLASILGKVGK